MHPPPAPTPAPPLSLIPPLVRTAGDSFTIDWKTTHKLESKTATKNRSMELSELVQFDHLLLAVCDITGLVHKVTIKDNKAKVLQRFALADGNGNSNKPFKSEWATVKVSRK